MVGFPIDWGSRNSKPQKIVFVSQDFIPGGPGFHPDIQNLFDLIIVNLLSCSFLGVRGRGAFPNRFEKPKMHFHYGFQGCFEFLPLTIELGDFGLQLDGLGLS